MNPQQFMQNPATSSMPLQMTPTENAEPAWSCFYRNGRLAPERRQILKTNLLHVPAPALTCVLQWKERSVAEFWTPSRVQGDMSPRSGRPSKNVQPNTSRSS